MRESIRLSKSFTYKNFFKDLFTYLRETDLTCVQLCTWGSGQREREKEEADSLLSRELNARLFQDPEIVT